MDALKSPSKAVKLMNLAAGRRLDAPICNGIMSINMMVIIGPTPIPDVWHFSGVEEGDHIEYFR
jgi:hypothetical protein